MGPLVEHLMPVPVAPAKPGHPAATVVGLIPTSLPGAGVYCPAMVGVDPKLLEGAEPDELAERLRKETDALVASSAKLVKEMDELMERARALKAAHDILLSTARSNRPKK